MGHSYSIPAETRILFRRRRNRGRGAVYWQNDARPVRRRVNLSPGEHSPMSSSKSAIGLSILALLAVLPCAAQNKALAGMHREFTAAKTSVLKAANKAPEDIYGFRPTPEVFTLRRMFLHIAGASYSICSSAAGKPGTAPKVDVTAETPKAEVIAKLNAAFAYCEDVFANSNDATLAETVPTSGGPREKSYYFSHLLGHTFLHYGNVVTYMRIKGMSPGD